MKVYYKTVDRGIDKFIGEHYPLSYEILNIEFCCDEMKEAYDGDAIGFGEFDAGVFNTNNQVNIAHCQYGCTEYALKYCPFCGKQIETIEKNKVKLIAETKVIQKKVTTYKEVPI